MTENMVTIERKKLEQALEALENTTPTGFNMERDKQFFSSITAIKEALAQPAQEPEQEPHEVRELLMMSAAMAVVMVRNGTYQRASDVADAILESSSKPAQEPVAWFHDNFGSVELSRLQRVGWQPIYTTPPQRKPLELSQMVRLTYDIDEDKPATQQELYNLIRKVEAAHGIKE